MNDGWEDDDDLDLLDDDVTQDAETAAPPLQSAAALLHQQFTNDNLFEDGNLPENAWEEEDAILDLVIDEDEINGEVAAAVGRSEEELPDGSNKYNHEDITPEISQQQQPIDSQDDSAAVNELYTELHDYMVSLPNLAAAVNDTFRNDYNTGAKAHELVEYYGSRPHLAQYTIETELPRMNYVLTDIDYSQWSSNSSSSSSKHHDSATEALATRLKRAAETHALLVRSANQSLLADPLQVLMTTTSSKHSHGSTTMIRTDYGMTCVATNVNINLHLPSPSMVQLQAELQVLVPTKHGERRVVGCLQLNVAFAPSHGTSCAVIEYKLAHVALADDFQDALLPWARCLMEQRRFDVELDGNNDAWSPHQNGSVAHDVRDSLVQQSHLLLQTTGMQAAWTEVKVATNKLPAFLPHDVLQEAMLEEERHSHEQQRQQQQQRRQQQHQQSMPDHRPTSILGGLVKKGWTQLANSVALPEEDESLYQAWQPQPLAQQQLDNDGQKQTTASNASERRGHIFDIPPFQQEQSKGLQLYRKSDEPLSMQPNIHLHSQRNAERDMKFETLKDVVPDGWDDDVDVAIDDGDDIDNLKEQDNKAVALSKSTSAIDDPFGFVTLNFKYDPVTDIRPTRKRWVNPFPGPRRLQP
ncbi:hypothetical protein MPSEU_000354700 [Mayamaea pseudoterrestris]|nr:hypothetical protein MPSEU_000354700 [Mayamaea pseudoterrestris]